MSEDFPQKKKKKIERNRQNSIIVVVALLRVVSHDQQRHHPSQVKNIKLNALVQDLGVTVSKNTLKGHMSLDLAIMINYSEKFLHSLVGLLQNHYDAHDDRQSPAQRARNILPTWRLNPNRAYDAASHKLELEWSIVKNWKNSEKIIIFI